MAWLSITLELEPAQAEALSEAIIEAGADSVDLEPGAARTRLTALAESDCDPQSLIARAAHLAGLPLPEFRASRVENTDWVKQAREQFGPIRVGARLWIVPTWHTPPEPSAVVVRLDPGLAFGTGSHPSTRLALAFLDRVICGGESVLDYGCGSGILAIAAAKLGAREVAGVDVDAQALEAASTNARLNAVELHAAAPGQLTRGTYDVIVANILVNPLITLEPELAARTRRGSRIALSGILETQAAEVVAAYAADFDCAPGAPDEGWILVEGSRR